MKFKAGESRGVMAGAGEAAGEAAGEVVAVDDQRSKPMHWRDGSHTWRAAPYGRAGRQASAFETR